MPELQDVFKDLHLGSLSPAQAKAFNMIRHCRTSSLESHSEVCTECGTVEVLQNQELLYSMLIRSAGHTLIELAKTLNSLEQRRELPLFSIRGARIYPFIPMFIVLFLVGGFPRMVFVLFVRVKSSLLQLK